MEIAIFRLLNDTSTPSAPMILSGANVLAVIVGMSGVPMVPRRSISRFLI